MFPNICKDHPPKTCELTSCIGNKCANYVKVQTPAFIYDNIIDPENYYRYEGCGLVHIIPWELVKRPERRAQQ